MSSLLAVIEVLPPGGLDHSILLAVLVGVWIALFFTETLGWVFVGLVVPGYLASVFVIQPVTAAVVVFEAVVTYGLARGLAYTIAPTGVWTPFFGRDRFFLIVILSVLVRQHDQLWLMPALAEFVDAAFGVDLPPMREFYSVGLVLVPLTANMLWKPGLGRGLAQIGVIVGLTYLVLTRVLLVFTNLSLGSFELLYEDTAIDFLGNAKAYMLLLTTAALAARYNLRYGWDFGGILVPALLGLLWLTPGELAVTIAEACVLWGAALLLIRRTPLARYNLEGPRKVALVLTLGIFLKWLLSLAIGERVPGLRARELYGFGYLLSTLLALRMLHRGSARRILLPTLTTAAMGWALGSILGFALGVLIPAAPPRVPGGPEVESHRLLRSELGVLALARVYAELAPERAFEAPAAHQARRTAFSAIGRWLEAPTEGNHRRAAEAAAEADVVLFDLPEAAWSMRHASIAMLPAEEGQGGSGLPAALLIPGATGPALAVPWPLSEAPAAEAALALCRALSCRAIVVAGRDGPPPRGPDPMAEALARLAPRFTLTLRGDLDVAEGRPQLHAAPRQVRELDVDALAPLIGPPEVLGRGDEAMTLRVHPRSLRELLLADAPAPRRARELLPWLAERAITPRERPLTADLPPSWPELVFLERRVARPLRGDDPEGLAHAGRMAALIDHEVWLIDACGAAGPCRALAERWRVGPASWGITVVDPGGAGPIFEVPRARGEIGAWRLAAELFSRAKGRALVIAPDTDLGHPFTATQALHQAVSGDLDAPATVIQIRGRRERPELAADVIAVGLGRPALQGAEPPPAVAAMFAADGPLASDPWILADASPALTTLAGTSNSQIRYTREFTRDAAAVLWFPIARRRVYAAPDPCPELARIAGLGLGLLPGEGDPAAEAAACKGYLRGEAAAVGEAAAEAASATERAKSQLTDPSEGATERAYSRSDLLSGPGLPERVRPRRIGFDAALARLEEYAETGNLHRLREVARAPGLRLTAGLGRASARGFLALCEDRVEGRCALVWLGPAEPGRAPSPGPELLPYQRARTILAAPAAGGAEPPPDAPDAPDAPEQPEPPEVTR